MGFDSHSMSFVAALFTTPTLRGIAAAKDRHRSRATHRGQASDHLKWLKRLEALQSPATIWADTAEMKSSTDATALNFFSSGFHPCAPPPVSIWVLAV